MPGFQFGVDVSLQQGPKVRGIWGDEGKLLILVNGLILTELAWGGTFGVMRMPTDFVERVEIIRGPGSALYGQFAEVAVINVITRKGVDLQGLRVAGTLTTQTINNTAYRYDISGGTTVGDADISLSVGSSLDPNSSRVYHDFYGSKFLMGLTNSPSQYDYIVGSAAYRGLSLQYRRQALNFVGQDGFATIIPSVNGIHTETQDPFIDGGALTYKLKPIESLGVELRAELVRANYGAHAFYPTAAVDQGTVIGSSDFVGLGSAISTTMYIYQVLLDYDFGVGGQLVAGGGYRRESVLDASNNNLPALYYLSDNKTGLQHDLNTEYVMAQYSNAIKDIGLSVTAGGRLEFTPFGNPFAPRVALTYAIDRVIAKALYGHAYRIPTGLQAYSQAYTRPGNKPLIPEETDSYEVELGYRIMDDVQVRANGFYVAVAKPLLFNGITATYVNAGKIQSLGFEAEVKWARRNYGAFANVSYAKPQKGTYA